jgi:general secretion pathway protein G
MDRQRGVYGNFRRGGARVRFRKGGRAVKTETGSPAIRYRRGGFTLIEVLIVIAILLAIGGLVLVNLMPAKTQADIDLQRTQFSSIDSAIRMFKLHMNRYPTQEEGLSALNSKDAIQDENEAAQWRGPYLETPVVKDKWNHEIIYRFPSEIAGEDKYDLISFGPDGQEGTKDDITNHDNMKNAQGEFDKGDTKFDGPTPPKSGG